MRGADGREDLALEAPVDAAVELHQAVRGQPLEERAIEGQARVIRRARGHPACDVAEHARKDHGDELIAHL